MARERPQVQRSQGASIDEAVGGPVQVDAGRDRAREEGEHALVEDDPQGLRPEAGDQLQGEADRSSQVPVARFPVCIGKRLLFCQGKAKSK